MAFHVRDRETDALVRELARKKGVGLTEAVKQAVSEELKREGEDSGKKPPLIERIRKIQDEIAKYPDTGVKTDKAFYHDLSGV